MGEEQPLQDVMILKIIDPAQIWAKEVPGAGMSEEARRFHEMEQKMQEYFEDEQMMPRHITSNKANKVCIGRRQSDRKWFRVKVNSTMQTSLGPQASCLLLDYAENGVMIPQVWLREAPQSFLYVPYQVREYVLLGLQPLSMVTSPQDLTTTPQPVHKWDPSASEFVTHLTKGHCCKIQVHGYDKDGRGHITLWARGGDENVCVNEKLLEDEYAIFSQQYANRVITGDSQPHQGEINAHPESASCSPRMSDKHVSIEEGQNQIYEISSVGEGPHQKQSQHANVGGAHQVAAPSVEADSRSLPKAAEKSSPSGELRSADGASPIQTAKNIPTEIKLPETETGTSEREVGTKIMHTSGPQHFTPSAIDRLLEAMKSNESEVAPPSKTGGAPTGRLPKLALAKKEGVHPQSVVSREPPAEKKTSQQNVPQRSSNSTQPPTHGQTAKFHKSPPGGAASKYYIPYRDFAAPPRRATPEYASDSSASGTEQKLRGRLPKSKTHVGIASPKETSQSGLNVAAALSPSVGDVQQMADPDLAAPILPSVRDDQQRADPSVGAPLLPSVKNVHQRADQDIAATLLPSARDAQQRAGLRGSGYTSGDSSGSEQRVQGRLPKAAVARSRSQLSGDEDTFRKGTQSSSGGEGGSSSSTSRPIRSILKKSPSSPGPPHRSLSGGKNVHVAPRYELPPERPGMKKSHVEAANRLLMQLAPDIEARHQRELEEDETNLRHESPEARALQEGVVVHGDWVPKPMDTLKSAKFHGVVDRVLTSHGRTEPTKIQAYCWPAVMRGRFVVGIAPIHSGRKLAILPPIITQILQTGAYQALPKGSGPLALILASSWRKCRDLYEQSMTFVSEMRNARVEVIYGGGAETNKQIALINGCEILVATPDSLLRMLAGGFTDLRRLCHLVLYDSDVLMEEFTRQIENLMQQYAQVLRDQMDLDVPRQTVLIGSCWTPGILSFIDAYLKNSHPIIIITSNVEASVYGGVKQIAYTCPSEERFNQLLGLLRTPAIQEHKVIVFTTSSWQAQELGKMLRQYYVTLVAHDDMSRFDHRTVSEEWSGQHKPDSRPILVMTDSCIADLRITDATFVVHYDVTSKALFGNRLICMMKNFTLPEERGSVTCESVIFVTDLPECCKQASSLAQFLQRVQSAVPEKLIKLARSYQQEIEEKKTYTGLCHYMKAFGKCRDANSCQQRHLVIPELDRPGASPRYIALPRSGEVKVLVMCIVDPTRYYVRLLQHTDQETNQVACYRSQYFLLVMAINQYYTTPGNKVTTGLPALGELCVCEEEDSTFHRLHGVGEVADLKYAGFYPLMPMPVPYPFNPVLGPKQHLPAFVSPKMQNKRKY